jgi:hypothetical protein
VKPSFIRSLPALLILLVVLWAAHGLTGDWLRWKETTAWNPAFLEALSWQHGQLALPYRLWDTAYVAESGRAYSVFPPLQSIIAFLVVGATRLTGDANPFPESHILPLLLFGAPLPIVGYWVFSRRTGSVFWGAVLTLGWLGGTAVMPCLSEARNDGVHHINHLLSQIGLLLFAAEMLGRRRIGPALIGLAIAAWSRQLTSVFSLALLAEAVMQRSRQRATDKHPERTDLSPERQRRGTPPPVAARRSFRSPLTAAIVGLTIVACVPMALNWAKFGSPFDNGYSLIYAGRDHDLARDAQTYGLFSPHFAARNTWCMNLALPWTRGDDGRLRWNPSELGTSMWLGTPLLVLVLLGVKTWWRDAAARAMILCSAVIIAALLMYHGTGQRQYGYWRFSLDFVPVWLVVAAPWLTTGWRRWPTLVCVAWSVAYFAMVCRWYPIAAS